MPKPWLKTRLISDGICGLYMKKKKETIKTIRRNDRHCWNLLVG